MNTRIFARITKVDEARQLVIGRAVQEILDKSNEVFDYDTSRPNFEKWSAEVFADSGGKSYGNIRAMHGNTAAGKITNIDFNDAEKAIDIETKIVDPVEFAKVLEGVYTGFSIGGRYARKWPENMDGKMVTRYTADPSEISLVDRPCIPTARYFDVQKRDGTLGKVLFKSFAPPATATSGVASYNLEGARVKRKKGKARKDQSPSTQETEADTFESQHVKQPEVGDENYGPAKEPTKKRDFSSQERKKAAHDGASLPDGSFPIYNSRDVKNAVSLHGHASNKTKAKAHIVRRAKAVGAEHALPDEWKKSEETGDLHKGMRSVAGLFCLLNELQNLACSIKQEQAIEAGDDDDHDDSTWQELLSELEKLAAIGGKLAMEEAGEAADGDFTDFYYGPLYRVQKALDGMGALAKEGRRNSAEDLGMLQHIHDTACKLGAACSSDDADDDDDSDDDDNAYDVDSKDEKSGTFNNKSSSRSDSEQFPNGNGSKGASKMRKSAQTSINSEGGKRGASVTNGNGNQPQSDNEDDKERTTAPVGSHGADRGFSSKRKGGVNSDMNDDEDEDDACKDADDDDDDDDDDDEETPKQMKARKAKKAAKMQEARMTKSITDNVLGALREAGVIPQPARRAQETGVTGAVVAPPALHAVGTNGQVAKSVFESSAEDLKKDAGKPVSAMKLQGEKDDVATLIKGSQRHPVTFDDLYK